MHVTGCFFAVTLKLILGQSKIRETTVEMINYE